MRRTLAGHTIALPLLCLLAVVLVGCGDDARTPTDASVDAPTADTSIATLPQIPWLDDGAPPIAAPELTPCPDGWREVSERGVSYCLPFPAAGPETCAAGQAHFLGEAGCTTIGATCPAGDWPEGLPTDGSVVYVQAGATGGDGTLAAPYGALSDVSWLSSAAKTIALAKGTYPGIARLRGGTRLVGACATETILVGEVGTAQAAIIVEGTGDPAEVRNLGILDPPQIGISVDAPRRGLVVEGVIIDGASDAGLLARESPLEARDLLIRNTRLGRDRIGGGIGVEDNVAVVERTIVEGGFYAAYSANTAATLTLRDVIARDVQEDPDLRDLGNALSAYDGASVTVERALFERNQTAAVFTGGGAPPTVTLTDVVLRDTRSRSLDGGAGSGMTAQGGTIEASRVVLVENRDWAIGALLAGSVSVSDAVVLDSQSREGVAAQGFGAFAGAGGSVELSRVLLDGNRDLGIAVTDASSSTVTDVIIRNMRPREDNLRSGRAVRVELGSRATLTRVLVDGALEAGISVHDVDSFMTLEDVVVRNTDVRESNQAFGAGVTVDRGARLEASRVLLERNVSDGVYVAGEGTVAQLTDLVVRDNETRGEQDTADGILTMLGATANLERVLIQNVELAGWLVLVESGGTARDLTIDSVMPRDCPFETCVNNPGGHGVTSVFMSTVRLERFDIRNAELCGVFVANPPTDLDLVNGRISGSPIGACVQVDGFDLSRLMDGVRYEDNGSQLEATSLPVPGTPASLEE